MNSNASNLRFCFGGVLLLLCWAGASAFGQGPVITSFSQNGRLVASNLSPGSMASVEWASSVLGPWTNTWAGLEAVIVGSNGIIQLSVPMFYRVREISAPVRMAFIPAGNFAMGNTFSGEGYGDELPTHTVHVSAFYMDLYEVTIPLWDGVYNWATNHGYVFEFGAQSRATTHPAHSMTWYDAAKWCNARSEMEGRTPAYYTSVAQTTVYRTGQVSVQNDWVRWTTGYRLPTEAEWEKAARGGASGHRFPWSDADTITHSRANYYSDAGYSYDTSPTRGYHPTFNYGVYPYTSPVGYFAPNGYGLYDMAGNVWEWCWDWNGAYSSSSQTDPRGPTSGLGRVLRGGSWRFDAFDCRSALRYSGDPTYGDNRVGFRSVLPGGQP